MASTIGTFPVCLSYDVVMCCPLEAKMILGYLQIHSFCDQNGTQQTAYYLCGRVASLVGKQNKTTQK